MAEDSAPQYPGQPEGSDPVMARIELITQKLAYAKWLYDQQNDPGESAAP
jgi:hypothetical protein